VNEPYMNESDLNLGDIVRIIRKRRWLIGDIVFFALAAAALISILLPKTYQTDATLRIKQSKNLAGSLLADLPVSNPLNTRQQMSTYAEIMKSRTVVERVIAEVYAGVPKERKPSYQELWNSISTIPVRDTEILKIQVEAKRPMEAQVLANTLVNTFIDRITYLVRSEQKDVRKFIGDRLAEAKTELGRAENTLEVYKRDQQILIPVETTRALVDRMAGFDKLEAENELELASVRARLENISQQLAKEKPGYIAENALIQQYRSKLAEQEVQLVGLLQKYTDKHPDVLALRAAIGETKERLNLEIARVINADASSVNPVHQNLLQGKIQAEAEITAAQAQKDALKRIINAAERNLSKLPAKEQGLVRVMRDADVAQEIYIMLAKRYEEARISEVMQPTDIQVIDVAVAPDPDKPIKPNKKMNLLITGFLSFCSGIGLAFLLEYLNQTICDADDVGRYLGLPVLGNIPRFERNDARPQNSGARLTLIAYEQAKSPVAEAYRTLRTNLQFSRADGPLQTLMYTSAGPGEGKSTIAANSAVVLAQTGKRVILVDCDLRKPGQHKIFNLSNRGVTDILIEDLPVSAFLQDTEIAALKVLTSGAIPPNPSELLGSARMDGLLNALKSSADYLIIDAPPVVAVTDACVLAAKMDGVVLVVKTGTVRPEMGRHAKELLLKANARILGAVLNWVELEKENAYYYYYYGNESTQTKPCGAE
jgi:succinoglycan biosynthesis transport protein ExoP